MRRAVFLGSTLATCFVPHLVRAADALPVHVAGMYLDASAEIPYALELGTPRSAGLDISYEVLNNGSAIVAAVMSGSIDIGFASPSPLIQARVRGLPVKFVAPAALWEGPAPNTGMVVLKTAPLKTAADLSGKIVGTSGLHDLTQYEALQWLEKNGGDVNAVQFIELPYAQMLSALEQGRISAALMTEPFLSNARASTTSIGNLSAAVGGRFLLAGWFASEPWLAKNAETAKRFAALVQQTGHWANAHQHDTAPILARYTKIDPDITATMPRARYGETNGVDPRTLQPLLDMIVKYAKLAPLPATDLIWMPPR
jgi:NitT/TauT family transport system substrate-binding protein